MSLILTYMRLPRAVRTENQVAAAQMDAILAVTVFRGLRCAEGRRAEGRFVMATSRLGDSGCPQLDAA